MESSRRQDRIAWIDVAKCVGIFMIYLGHYGPEAGLGYTFVSQFHVPLFFFLAGCTERIHPHGIKDSLLKATRKLLIPFYLFGVLYLIVYCLVYNTFEIAPSQLLILAEGAVRNQYIAGSLWFLTCLWVIEIVFPFFQRWRSVYLWMMVAGIQIIVTWILPVNPMQAPRLWYNVDSAFAYGAYYILGYLLFPWIKKLLNTNEHIVPRHIIGILVVSYAVFTFVTEGELITSNKESLVFLAVGVPLHVLILICAVLYLSYLLQGIRLFQSMGRETLYLCGNENLLELIVPIVLQTFGLQVTAQNPLSAIIYSAALVMIAYKAVIPLEKKMMKGLFQ